MTAVRTIGIMTGNSLDGVDIVLTGFENGRITDLGGCQNLIRVQPDRKYAWCARIREEGGRMEKTCRRRFFFWRPSTNTRRWLRKLSIRFCRVPVAVGRYCRARLMVDHDHFPPSIAGGEPADMVQVGNAGVFG